MSQPDDPAELAAQANLYIAVNASTVELPDIERYTADVAADKVMVLWNLGIDTLRADLGECSLLLAPSPSIGSMSYTASTCRKEFMIDAGTRR
jgi:hypothetical protein